MELTLIKKNKLSIFTLPETIRGSHWITEFENGKKINLINIEATEAGWQVVSNDDAFIVDENGIMVPYTILKEYSFYVLKNNYKNESYYLYTCPVIDKTYKEMGFDGNKIVIGSSNSSDLCFNLKGIPSEAFKIEKINNYFYVTNLNEQTSLYVNKKRILDKTRIEYGDILFSFGLKIIPIKKNGADCLLVNNPANLLGVNASLVNILPEQSSFVEDHKELSDDSLYKEVEYFYRAPHFYKKISKCIINVDTPPTKKEEDKTPVALTIGPMLTMSMTSVVMLLSTFNSINKGERDLSSSMTSIVMCIAMLGTTLLWPILTKTFQKFQNKMYERKRKELYKEYINKKEKEIENARLLQRTTLLDNYFTVTDCQNIIRGLNVKLWQRRITDEDFLTLPVGIGNTKMDIEIHYPEEHFSLETDVLLDIAHSLGQKDRILDDVPITYSFFTNIATGIVGDAITTKEFIDRLVLQMMANYSYDELKIVTMTSSENSSSWDYIKTTPHSWSNDFNMRYFGSENEDYREIMYLLERIYNERKETDNLRHIPHYVIITDAIKSIDSYDFLKEIMSKNVNIGISIIMLVDKVSALPNECKNFIKVSRETSAIFSSVLNQNAINFKIDFSPIDEIYNCASILANIPLDIKTEVESSLPEVYEFLEMYQVGKVEQLNSRERWKKSNPILSLAAPVGIGKSGETINLDLHEKYHGPHGLIAGTTGSGKSEFIITYVLSLAVNFSPEEVQVILIDYKGGSLAGSFANDMYTLPHLAGTITNLDGNELNRSLASIESEIKRRQKEFNDARQMTNESSIDIYKYQKLYREGKLEGKEPIAHLFIISDEFAELKEQQPEFMEKLISAARVGRSLGIHLILATQKPGGVVDPQIWSNSRFRVCLKVQDTQDSQEVLKKSDAAYLKKTGLFYLQVGYDEVYTLAQSAWTGGKYYPSTTFKHEVDTSVNVINNIGFITNSKEEKVKEVKESLGEELPNIVKYLSDLARNENIKIKKLWLDKIPEKIYIDSLKSKYNFTKKDYYIDPFIGEYDDPSTQNQYVLSLPLSKLGNAIIYGITGSGKEQFLTSLIYSSISSYTEKEINFYILDFGSETLRNFSNAPHVGDVAFVIEEDKVKNLFKMITTELNNRKNLFASFNGEYNYYINSSNEKLPNIVIIINNYESFIENYEDLTETLNALSREAFKYGIFFVITANNETSVRIRTKQNFQLVYALAQNTEADFSSILGNCKGKYPAKYKGRGLFKKDNIYEFQTASITKDEQTEFLKIFISNLNANTTYKAKRIPILPNVVNYDYIKSSLTASTSAIIGVNKEKLNLESYNFDKNVINLISSYELENTTNFITSLINEIGYINVYDLILINTTEINIDSKYVMNKTYKNGYDKLIDSLYDYTNAIYNEYESSSWNNEVLNNKKKELCIIFGVHDFINKLNTDYINKFTELMKKNSAMNIISFVLVDNPDILKTYSYDEWFKLGADTSRGIWISSGIAEQSLIKVAKFDREDREEISNEYGYLVTSSKLYKIKLLTSFEVKKEE